MKKRTNRLVRDLSSALLLALLFSLFACGGSEKDTDAAPDTAPDTVSDTANNTAPDTTDNAGDEIGLPEDLAFLLPDGSEGFTVVIMTDTYIGLGKDGEVEDAQKLSLRCIENGYQELVHMEDKDDMGLDGYYAVYENGEYNISISVDSVTMYRLSVEISVIQSIED